MAGLDPAIHVLLPKKRKQDVDARIKSAHDGVRLTYARRYSATVWRGAGGGLARSAASFA